MKSLRGIIAIVVAVLAFAWFVWVWGFCRFYVQPGYMAIVTTKHGKPLPRGQILAKDGEMGIQEDVLGEGRHFRDPIQNDVEIQPLVEIPPGKLGIVTSKVGDPLPQGEFLAEPGQKGIWRRVLGPGKYRMNPYGYDITQVDAVSIKIGYVGVITSLSGKQAPDGAFAGPNEKGVRKDILQPGLYYVNPKEIQVDVLEIGVNQVSLLGREGGAVVTKGQMQSMNVAMDALQGNTLQQQAQKREDYYNRSEAEGHRGIRVVDNLGLSSSREWSKQQAAPAQAPAKPPTAKTKQGRDQGTTHTVNEFVSFPSRDGFQISLDMTLEFELLPDKIAILYRSYGDLPAVVDTIIMPQILSITRNKGSEYKAKDFIVGEGREKFQKDITESLARTMTEKNIVTHNALIRHVDVPMQILDPIQRASLAIEQDLTNKERQNTAKRLAELNTELSLVEQRSAQVAQETIKLKAEIVANQEKQVAQIQADTLRQAATIEQETASVRATKTLTIGKAAAESVTLVEGAKARGYQMKTEAYGDPMAFSFVEFAAGLRPDLSIRILHAGPGTLWTDLQKATMGDVGGASLIQKSGGKP